MVNGGWSPLHIPGAVQGRLGGQGYLKVAVGAKNIRFFNFEMKVSAFILTLLSKLTSKKILSEDQKEKKEY